MIKKNQSKNKYAFTLVEMAIVLFIISLLILLIVPNLSKQRTHADKVNTEALQTELNSQAQLYADDKNVAIETVNVKMLENDKYLTEKQAEKSGKKFTDYGKLLKIAMRIMNGDKVPMADRKKLAEEMPDLYKQAILMRRLDNDKPKKYKSEYEDDKDKTTVEKMLDGMDGSDDPSDIMTDLLGSTDK